jgi:hypothetical protein
MLYIVYQSIYRMFHLKPARLQGEIKKAGRFLSGTPGYIYIHVYAVYFGREPPTFRITRQSSTPSKTTGKTTISINKFYNQLIHNWTNFIVASLLLYAPTYVSDLSPKHISASAYHIQPVHKSFNKVFNIKKLCFNIFTIILRQFYHNSGT